MVILKNRTKVRIYVSSLLMAGIFERIFHHYVGDYFATLHSHTTTINSE
ncbi:hypothetical protein SECTIM467_149 [Brevibacillus phage SecTim467]|uniref:Uncharacterized protein n=2 Tax=Jenstvirus jenst TaxID=1982225 RepID=A0A0K2CPI3_9CAUD|nr:hypothetical protein AVV11_gp047 [Brevibacillus phage Jenst]ALA07273.1 hypothetical protein JENST_144 [Brevibacillus phage Jenst]ALA07474.1 hypothetical protein SECTIM467_149 [Brevibacillus phage SecTim467]